MREPTAYNINEDQIDPFNRRHINRRFAEAVAQLGPEGKNTWGFFWTIRPKNDQSSWDRCNAIAEGVNKKLTRGHGSARVGIDNLGLFEQSERQA